MKEIKETMPSLHSSERFCGGIIYLFVSRKLLIVNHVLKKY